MASLQLRSPLVNQRGAENGRSETIWRLAVDFPLARRRVEALSHHSSLTRARALAAYVGAFDFADDAGLVDASSEEIAAAFEISRVSWLQYRTLLEEAGLIEVDELRGGTRRSFRLLAP